MQDAKEEVKARLPVEEVIGKYIELKRSGRTLKGHSPWGVDRTPSFMVSPEKGVWHDFSANKGGDIFTFVMEVEGISFKEALEKLAAEAGVDLSKYSGGDRGLTKRKARAREALRMATRYYRYCLSKNKEVCDYVFYKRNLNQATVKEFLIGYAPSTGQALKNYLTKKGFSEAELKDAGLLNRFGGDLFRGRMMIPFIDSTGNVIGYTARVIKDGEPKYLNTPETLLFNKSRFVFGLHEAKGAIRHDRFVVIVEGNMDVISSHQAGVKQTVATSGTAMTEQQLKMLKNLTDDIRLAYDGDAAGIRATERAIELAGGMGITLSVISDYHGAKDPDELIQKDPKLWQKAVEEREPAVDWVLKKYEEQGDLDSAPGKKEYTDVALKLISYLKDEVERASYEEKVAEKVGVSVEILREKGARLSRELEKKQERKYYKPVKTATPGKTVENPVENFTEDLRRLENSLLSLKIFGGITKTKIPLEVPEDETKLDELELIFNTEHPDGGKTDELEAEAQVLLAKYETARKKTEISDLGKKLEGLSEEDPEFEKTLKAISELQKEQKQDFKENLRFPEKVWRF